MAVIIVNRLKVLYWHPFLQELVANAIGANATGEIIKVLVDQVLGAKNEEERSV